LKNSLFLFFLIWFITGCEKDDICLRETPGTPRLVVEFFDINNKNNLKSTNGLKIIGKGKENLLYEDDTSSLLLPLKNNQNTSTFIFFVNNNDSILSDTIQFKYLVNDIYINRACGFKSEFILDNNPIKFISNNLNFIKDFNLKNSTVSDEDEVHLSIYH
tara:strand:- start:10126 stop:10605 length:480 start_codon:yes stop_codon:yes gene_type:complete